MYLPLPTTTEWSWCQVVLGALLQGLGFGMEGLWFMARGGGVVERRGVAGRRGRGIVDTPLLRPVWQGLVYSLSSCWLQPLLTLPRVLPLQWGTLHAHRRAHPAPRRLHHWLHCRGSAGRAPHPERPLPLPPGEPAAGAHHPAPRAGRCACVPRAWVAKAGDPTAEGQKGEGPSKEGTILSYSFIYALID